MKNLPVATPSPKQPIDQMSANYLATELEDAKSLQKSKTNNCYSKFE